MGVDTLTLRWFQQVADGVSVTEVSEIWGTSQPGVSRALARLEREVGTPLLRRSGRALRVTHAGLAFKRHVDAVIHHLDDGLAAVSQIVDPASGTVTLAFQPSLGTWLVPSLVAGFRAAHPAVRFDLRPKRDELVPAVGARGVVDLELATQRPGLPDLRWSRLAQEPLRLAVPSAHPLAGRDSVALADVADLPLVAIRPSSQLRHLVDDLLRAAGVAAEPAFVCDDLPTVRGFVAAGLGVAVVPPSAGEAGGVRYLVLSDPGASREIGLVWSAERRLLPAAERFRRHVLDEAAAGRLLGGPLG